MVSPALLWQRGTNIVDSSQLHQLKPALMKTGGVHGGKSYWYLQERQELLGPLIAKALNSCSSFPPQVDIMVKRSPLVAGCRHIKLQHQSPDLKHIQGGMGEGAVALASKGAQ